MNPFRSYKQWLTLDERRTDAVGWTFNLAIFRIIFLAAVVLPFARGMLQWASQELPSLPPAIWAPVSYYRLIPMSVLTNVELTRWLAFANVVLVIAGLAGVFTRYTLTGASILSLYLFGLVENLGKVDHYHYIVWFMILLAVGPSGDLLSVDAVFRALRRADRGAVEPEVPGFAALWTLRYTWALLGLLYLVPGLAKLQAVFVTHWASAEQLRRLIWFKWFELLWYQPGFVLPPRVDRFPSWVLQAFGLGAIAFEVGVIALILLRPTRWLAGLGGLLFHTLSGFVLRIPFTPLQIAYACVIDWRALARSFGARKGRRPLQVLYDGDCTLCRRTIAILRSLDLSGVLEPIVGRSDDVRRPRHHEITPDMLVHDMYVLREDQPLRGYDAYVAIAERMPLLVPLSILMKVPPFAVVGPRVYRRVAEGRRCSVVRDQRRPASSKRTSARWIHRVGSALIVAQTLFSVMTFCAGLNFSFLPPSIRAVVKGSLAKYDSLRLVWPFDTFPTFAHRWPGSTVVWDARLVFAGGRETRITANAYAPFCNVAQCNTITSNLLEDRDLIRRRKRSLEIVRALWRYEGRRLVSPPIGVRVYRARYSVDPGVTQPLDQNLLYEFPISVISSTSRASAIGGS